MLPFQSESLWEIEGAGRMFSLRGDGSLVKQHSRLAGKQYNDPKRLFQLWETVISHGAYSRFIGFTSS